MQPDPDLLQAGYDILLAADGASSQLRKLLSAELPGFSGAAVAVLQALRSGLRV